MDGDEETRAIVNVSPGVRLRLARSAVQVIADESDVDILHIKGDAVDPRLRPVLASGTDVDALVRPTDVPQLDAALRAHGWRVYSTFINGSPFGHAQTYAHPAWGFFDLHRSFPGIRLEPSRAFELVWKDRHEIELPGVRASVPSVEMQATLLVLNAARNRTPGSDAVRQWIDEPGLDRARVHACVDQLEAWVAFAAGTGELERYRGAREYRLWRVITQGGSRSAEWWARIRAAGTIGEALRIASRAPLVNLEKLEHELGRQPTRAEIAGAFVARPARAINELAQGWTRSGRR